MSDSTFDPTIKSVTESRFCRVVTEDGSSYIRWPKAWTRITDDGEEELPTHEAHVMEVKIQDAWSFTNEGRLVNGLQEIIEMCNEGVEKGRMDSAVADPIREAAKDALNKG